MSNLGKLNVYTCPKGHTIVTKDVEDGVTPFMTKCEECGGLDGRRFPGGMMRSGFYQVDQSQEHSHEWYRPPVPWSKIHEATRNHLRKGGLILRQRE